MARGVACVAALAVSLIGVLPSAHVHADDDHQIVHQHAIADGPAHPDDHADDHGTDFDHPDHAAARLLTLSYDLTSHVSLFVPPGGALWLVAQPVAAPAPLLGTTLLPTHDPPLRFTSSPAPPAFV